MAVYSVEEFLSNVEEADLSKMSFAPDNSARSRAYAVKDTIKIRDGKEMIRAGP